MTSEINKNTNEFFMARPNAKLTAKCYLNTSTNQFLWVLDEIKETKNVDHLVRVESFDFIKEGYD